MIRLCIGWLAAASLAYALPVTLGFSAQGSGGALGTPGGSDLPIGCRVMLGTFALTPAHVAAAANDQFTLLAAFQPLASATIGTFNGLPQNIPGGFSSSITLEASEIAGKRVYLWAFDAASPAAATSHVLLSSPAWIIPSFGSLNCETSQIPFSSNDSVVIATRQPGSISTTLGGTLNRAIPLAHPDHSDADADGTPALLEWATGNDPAIPGQAPLALQQNALTFTRFSGATGTRTRFSARGITYQIEASADLLHWSPLPDSATQVPILAAHPTRAGMETLTLPLLQNGTPRRFWRLGVTRN